MPESSVPALTAPPPARDNPFTRSLAGMIGIAFLAVMVLACVGSLPWTTGSVPGVAPGGGPDAASNTSPRYDVQDRTAVRLPPAWWPFGWGGSDGDPDTAARRLHGVSVRRALERLARDGPPGATVEQLQARKVQPTPDQVRAAAPIFLMGTDVLGRDVFVRCLAGGGISLTIGIAAAMLSVVLGAVYGAVSGYVGGRTDALLMRIVDVLYGLPYVLLVVLLAVAGDAAMEEFITRSHARQRWVVAEAAAAAEQQHLATDRAAVESRLRADETLRKDLEDRSLKALPPRQVSPGQRTVYDLGTLLVAIGGVSWLTMARVIRGQVLSLKAQPFMEAARAIGVPLHRLFLRHLLPNLLGPIIVYATLTVPQAILQESFLSFLGIGVKPPLPSWGNMAAEGLVELNPYKSHWWMLLFPCLLLGTTLLALNFVGEGLREAYDPKRARR